VSGRREHSGFIEGGTSCATVSVAECTRHAYTRRPVLKLPLCHEPDAVRCVQSASSSVRQLRIGLHFGILQYAQCAPTAVSQGPGGDGTLERDLSGRRRSACV
jgi:hypothetical protein